MQYKVEIWKKKDLQIINPIINYMYCQYNNCTNNVLDFY